MKRTAFLFFLFISTQLNAAADLSIIRDLFGICSFDKASCYNLVSMTRAYELSKDPVLYAYHAAGEMTMATHEFWPPKKLEHFNSGKWKLEAAIKKHPKNVEMRYIRYSVQQGSPFFLDYSKHLDEDRKYVLDNMDQTDWTESYKKKVREFLQ